MLQKRPSSPDEDLIVTEYHRNPHMPLHVAETVPLSPRDVPDQFVIFYSSVVNGILWCPDCGAVDPIIQETFQSPSSPSAMIIYVGDRATWRDPNNIFRAEPWNISSVPTIVRLRDHREDARLVDDKIIGGLASLVQGE